MCLSAQFISVYPNSSKCSLCELQILGRKLAEKKPTLPALLSRATPPKLQLHLQKLSSQVKLSSRVKLSWRCKASASNIASLSPSCAPSWPCTCLQLSTKIQFPQFLLSQWPTSSNAPHHGPLSPVLQLDLQPKPSGRFDLPVPAPHGPPPSSHVTPSWAYSKPPPPLACACSRPITQTSISSREREKPTPSAANYQAYESSTWAVDLTSWLV